MYQHYLCGFMNRSPRAYKLLALCCGTKEGRVEGAGYSANYFRLKRRPLAFPTKRKFFFVVGQLFILDYSLKSTRL